jgi:hypothetical protein
LKYHAHDRGGTQLWVYDKTKREFREQPTSTFLAPRGEHSEEIEARLSKIEGPAARAAAAIHLEAEPHRPGFIRIAADTDPDEQVVAPLRDGPVIEQFRLAVVDAQTRRLAWADRQALGSFVALMYARSPKIQSAIRAMAAAYLDGLVEGASRLGTLPRKLTKEMASAEERVRWVGLTEAEALGNRLAASQWYLLKAGTDESFVLGDSAVVTSLAIGHDDVWRPLFDDATYAVTLPLGPTLCLIIAPRLMVPGAGPDWDPVRTTAMLSWKWAERFVVCKTREALEGVVTSVSAAGWGAAAPVTADASAARERGVNFVAPYLGATTTRSRKRRHRTP